MIKFTFPVTYIKIGDREKDRKLATLRTVLHPIIFVNQAKLRRFSPGFCEALYVSIPLWFCILDIVIPSNLFFCLGLFLLAVSL